MGMNRPATRHTFESLRRLDDRLAKNLKGTVEPGSKLLVAVSGGPDSVALAHLLKKLPYSLVIGHIDHRLRKGSARDARFVAALANQWDIPFAHTVVSVRTFAERHRMGLEEAARMLRYQALSAMARKYRCRFIVTGHTANDQAETVLMNFMRGAGSKGLAGIPPKRLLTRSIAVIRPLLFAHRSEIMLYLKTNSLPWRTDPTNQDRDFTRNWIRHGLLPHLDKKFPGLSMRLIQMADIFREEEDFWTRLSQQKTLKRIDLAGLFRYHKALVRRKMRLSHPGLSFQDVENQISRRSTD